MKNKKPFGIIYKATNLINGKPYIGQTVKTLHKRKIEHKSNVKRNSKNYYFYNGIKKYGWDNFEWVTICECSSRDELNEKETFYINELNSLAPNGYNLTLGGNGTSGFVFTPEHIKKMSDAKKGKTWEEIRGNEDSERSKKEISKRMMGKGNHRYGITPSAETIRKRTEKIRKYSDEQIEQVREYRKQGFTFKKISDIMCINESTLDDWARDIKIIRLGRKYSDEQIKMGVQYRKQGMTLKEVSDIMKVPMSTVRHWQKKERKNE